MPELLRPGVIVQEVPFGPQPIEGVSTSTAGFVGESPWGPSDGPPTLVTSWPDFERKFGGLLSGATLGYAVRGFFENGGRRAFIARVTGDSTGTLAIPHTTGGTGGWLVSVLGSLTDTGDPNEYRMKLGSVVGLVYGTNLTLIDRREGTRVTLDVTEVDATTGVVVATAQPDSGTGLTEDLTGASGDRWYARIGTPGSDSTVLSLVTRDKGAFASRLSVYIQGTYGRRTRVRNHISTTELELDDGTVLRKGDRVQLDTGSGSPRREVAAVEAVNPASGQLELTSATAVSDPGTFDYSGGQLRVCTWRFDVLLEGDIVETLEGVTSDPERLAAELESRSAWIRVAGTTTPPIDPARAARFPTFASVLPLTFTAGSTASVTDTDVVGTTVPTRSGIATLETQDQVSIIAAPGYTSPTVVNAMIGQAERLKDRFAVIDADDDADVNDVLAKRGVLNSSYAAMYYPHVRVPNPLTNSELQVAPSGHVVGAYARTDNDRGVFKAPANVGLRGVLGFTRDVTDGEQDILNPAGVNVLRRLEGLGLVIWGARTISADTLWKYVPVRRLFIFLEQSIARGTRYAVFEPNAQPLWSRIDDSVTDFLETQWRSGALFGERAEDAFFVRVDETTTTQVDRDNGVVNIEVGIAPAKPAEFVVFKIGQAPSSVIIAEQT